MTAESTALTLCRLLGAWVNGAPPETGETPDFGALLETSRRHFLTAAACGALESAGLMEICPPETAKCFRDAKQAAARPEGRFSSQSSRREPAFSAASQPATTAVRLEDSSRPQALFRSSVRRRNSAANSELSASFCSRNAASARCSCRLSG